MYYIKYECFIKIKKATRLTYTYKKSKQKCVRHVCPLELEILFILV